MKNIISVFFIVLLLFTGCNKKKSEQSKNPPKVHKPIIEKPTSTESNKTDVNHTVIPKNDSFILKDIQNKNLHLSIDRKDISLSDVNQSIVLINLFSTWCPPCQGQIDYLSDLQKKYKKNLFIIGLLVNDSIDKEELKAFIKTNYINYFVSNSIENKNIATTISRGLNLGDNYPLPLSILYFHGKYKIHYEGAIPVEMLAHDLKDIINNEGK